MMDDKTRAEMGTIWRIAYIISIVDLFLATLCAASGNAHFVGFMILAGVMWAYGTYFKRKSEETEE